MALGFSLDSQEFCNLIEEAINTFDFTLPGEAGGSLGDDLVVRAATGIHEYTSEGEGPNEYWPANAPQYAEYKRKRYGVSVPGELGGQMLSLLSLIGKPVFGANEIEMVYGLGEPPRRSTSRSGVPLRRSELVATDREKAEWFTEGGRPFYEFNETIEISLVDLCGKRLVEHIGSVGLYQIGS